MRNDFCEVTYLDALDWSAEERALFIRDTTAFLSTCMLDTAQVQAVIQEVRAVRFADADLR